MITRNANLKNSKMHSRDANYKDYYENMWTSSTTNDPMQVNLETDIVVQEVKAKFEERSQIGIKKYGTTLEHSKQDTLEFINHLMEELMDATLYLQKIKHLIK